MKIDGFRALAHIQNGKCDLISRNGNVFRGFADLATWIAEHLRVESAVLDGEIACIDDSGRPVFRDLLFRRGQCAVVAISGAARRLGIGQELAPAVSPRSSGRLGVLLCALPRIRMVRK